jgi:predicted NBD/HSP70 family sugar kinase
MYIGVDVGGTKTLVAVLNNQGVIQEKTVFPTPETYAQFLKELASCRDNFKTQDFKAGGCGIPTTVFNRDSGVAVRFGNLPWKNVSVQGDLEKIFDCPIAVENDAKLAGLSEAMLLKDKYSKIAYVTISTGIGYSLINKGIIDTSVGDGGGRTIMLDHKGKLMAWEDFASGRAIMKKYGKRAADITDEAAWKAISRNLAKGFIHLIAILQPEVIVIGGGVGTHFDRFGKLLATDLEKYKLPLNELPKLIGAGRPEEAVIYGCYDLAKQVYGHG